MLKKPLFMSMKAYLDAITFARALKKQDNQITDFLRDPNRKFNVDIAYDPDTGKWGVYDQMCSLGGCYIGGDEFDTEESALREAAIRTLQGDKLTWDTPCGECYAEYMKQCE
jgi:hypothetical protein